MSTKERLDVALVTRGLAESREKAQAMILSGAVFLNGQRADKASMAVREEDTLQTRGAPHPYVSRGGLKLEKALRVFSADVRGVTAMDLGASTGGFTDVLLRAGAAHVYAVDVGYGQLDWKLRNDPRVTVMERTNARLLVPEMFPVRPSLAVMDVSFISIRLILPAAAAIMGETGRFLTLVKPQFEAGRGRVGKKGVVRDPQVHRDVLEEIRTFVQEMGWTVQGMDFSPIRGPEGNIEFLFDIVPQACARANCGAEDVARTVAAAHAAHGG
ncbi:MAG TPA: TlyA family RNA methyltransferase [Candidatus Aphodomonas merdavium]|nr:TlyA family RNA methyltransferase [Candidatus Aphodomonas merdavium]